MADENAVEERESTEEVYESEVRLPEGVEAETRAEIEVDYSDAEPEPESEPEAEVEAQGETSTDEPPPADPLLELRDELRRLKQQNSELQGYYHRLAGTSRKEEDVPDEPPAHLRDKPQEQWTARDVLEYMEWDKARTTRDVRAQALAEARAASSEQRARGLFSASTLGQNYDYDSVISRYIEPMERENPAFRQLIAQQADPAVAKYMLGFMMEMLESSGGDQVKMVKSLREAMQRKGRTNQEVFSKIKAAEKKAAVKTQLRPTRSATPKKKITAEDIDKMSIEEFEALDQRINGARL